MTWRDRLSRVGLAITLAASGCMAGPAPLSALPAEATAVREDGPDVARSQKPDAAPRPTTPVCLISLPLERPAEAAQARPAVVIRAVVNGEPIFDEEVQMSCAPQLAAARTPKEREDILKQALEQIIDRELLLQDAIARLERGGPQALKMLEKLKELADQDFEKHWLRPLMKEKHLTSREQLAALMREHNLSLDLMRRGWTRNYMSKEYLLNRLEPHISRIGHLEIADYYASHREEFTQPDSVEWKDIFIDASRHASRAAARQFAESLVRRARQGEDFAKLSAEFDNGTSGRFRKGDGQGRKHGEIFPPEAEPVLFRMHEGDIDIVERRTGFHVIQLVKRQVAGPIPFNETVQKEIHNKLRMAVFLQERERIIKELKRKAVIDPPVRDAPAR